MFNVQVQIIQKFIFTHHFSLAKHGKNQRGMVCYVFYFYFFSALTLFDPGVSMSLDSFTS